MVRPVHEVGLAMALPGRLGGALANGIKHVQIAISGLKLSDRTFAKFGGAPATKHFHATLKKYSGLTIAPGDELPAGQPSSISADRPVDDHNMAWHRQPRPSEKQNHSSSFQRQRPIASARAVHVPAESGVPHASVRPHAILAAAAAGRRGSEPHSERAKLVSDTAGGGEARADARHNAEARGTARAFSGRKVNSAAIAANAAVEPGAPVGKAARLKLTVAQRPPGLPEAAGQNNAEAARLAPSLLTSMPGSQISETSRKPRSAQSGRSDGAAAPYAPVRRAAPRSDGISSTAAPNEVSRDWPANPRGRGADHPCRAGTAEGAAIAPKDNDAAAPAGGGGPTQGDVFLDGTLVGRWMARKMAQEAGRPPSGSPAFDPTRSPFPPGRMIGG